MKTKRALIIVLALMAVSPPPAVVRAQDATGPECPNPIIAGFYPDPSICRLGDDYYLVNSTFAYYPGITVFHSRDLVDWRLIGYVINRPGQLRYDSLGVSRGIFAPAIRHHGRLFYVTCTFVDGGGNFIVTASDPAGPWSDPVWLPQVNGIDPSLFFDDDGKAYLIYNSVAPDDRPLYQGHRTIRMREFDIDSLRVTGEERILVNGGTDISRKPVWIEGPHMFKVNGLYYLIAAEGGTAEDHSEVVFRSTHVDGPYVPFNDNPILTQRDLDPGREDPITCTGHADFVQTPGGAWWAVFLGCQPYPPYTGNFYNTGRETFLAPVTWKDGWPIIISHGEAVRHRYPCPFPNLEATAHLRYGGSFQYTDNFDSTGIGRDWEFLRAPREEWYSLTQKRGFLSMRLRPEMSSDKGNPGFLGRRQQHAISSATTAMTFAPRAENEKAGLLVFQNESHFYFLCKSVERGRPAIQLYRSAAPTGMLVLIASRTLGEATGTVFLGIRSTGNRYAFSFSMDERHWNLLMDSVDATFLSTKVAGGFVGCMYALYGTSQGKPAANTAYFDWFTYAGEERETKN